MSHLTMSAKELDRFYILQRLIRKEFNATHASLLLQLTVRQIRRLKAAMLKHGVAALIHGNRGQPSNRRLSDQERTRIQRLVSKNYLDFTPTFDAEKLREIHQMTHDPKTIEPIFANSPQAKGRVERLFRTLQDRLVKELRLHGISTVAEANLYIIQEFIPDFNQRFAVEPASPANLHTSLTATEQKQLPSILSRQEIRSVHNDYTIAFKNSWYQLLPTPRLTVSKGDVVTMEEWVDSSLHIRLRGKELIYRLLPERSKKAKTIKSPWVLTTHAPHKPSATHPWRQHQKLHLSTSALLKT